MVLQALNLNSGELMAVKCVELGNVSDADMEEVCVCIYIYMYVYTHCVYV